MVSTASASPARPPVDDMCAVVLPRDACPMGWPSARAGAVGCAPVMCNCGCTSKHTLPQSAKPRLAAMTCCWWLKCALNALGRSRLVGAESSLLCTCQNLYRGLMPGTFLQKSFLTKERGGGLRTRVLLTVCRPGTTPPPWREAALRPSANLFINCMSHSGTGTAELPELIPNF